MDVIQAQARVCAADPRKYSKIKDWSKNPGMVISKTVKRSFIDQLQKAKKQIPAPNKYK